MQDKWRKNTQTWGKFEKSKFEVYFMCYVSLKDEITIVKQQQQQQTNKNVAAEEKTRSASSLQSVSELPPLGQGSSRPPD